MKAVTVVAATVLLSAPGWAAEGDLPYRTSGLYLGIGVGYSDLEFDNPPLGVSGGDFAYKILGGYRFTPGFLPWGMTVALEAAWLDLGEATDDLPGAEFGLSLDGLEGNLVAYLPLTRNIDLFGKAGVMRWDAELSVNGATVDDNDGTDLTGGIGLALQTGGAFGAQLEIQGYDMLDGAMLGSLSFTYQFK